MTFEKDDIEQWMDMPQTQALSNYLWKKAQQFAQTKVNTAAMSIPDQTEFYRRHLDLEARFSVTEQIFDLVSDPDIFIEATETDDE